MKIAQDMVVSIAYKVMTDDGVVVDESTVAQPLEYLHGHNALIPGLENALNGHNVGEKMHVDVKATDAYGEYSDALVQRVPKEAFVGVDDIEVGMRFLADTDQGPVPVEITEVDGDFVIVDGNHMLAGKDLSFDVEIVAVRAATAEEIAHGHLHGEHEHEGCCGGHGHDHDDFDDEEGGCCGGGSCGSQR